MGEHMNIGWNDIRRNDIGLTGTPYDLECLGTKFVYNRIGATGWEDQTYPGVKHCSFAFAVFFGNSEIGLEAYNQNNIQNCRFGTASTDVEKYLVLRGGLNNVGGSRFYSQVDGKGATVGCV